MSLSCDCSFEGDWYYIPDDDFTKLDTKRSRRCKSCRCKISPGEDVISFVRFRSPENDIEERIHGDEVPMATWYHCERCGGLYLSVAELGMCCDIGEDMAKQIREWREWE